MTAFVVVGGPLWRMPPCPSVQPRRVAPGASFSRLNVVANRRASMQMSYLSTMSASEGIPARDDIGDGADIESVSSSSGSRSDDDLGIESDVSSVEGAGGSRDGISGGGSGDSFGSGGGSSGGGGGGGGGGSDGSGGGSGYGSGNGGSGDAASFASSTFGRDAGKQVERFIEFQSSLLSGAKGQLSQVLGFFGQGAQSILKILPPQVITALIGLASGYAAQQRKVEMDKAAAAEKKRADVSRKRLEMEKHLRRLYELNHGPLLKAACKLSERLYTLVEDKDSAWSDDDKPYSGTLYTAYLFGKYFGYVEHIKRQSHQTLDLGFPAADQIFLNILGRIQSTLAAQDAVLGHLQRTETSFSPIDGRVKKAGPFRITPRSQVAMGEVMLRNREAPVEEQVSAADVISFAEFVVKMRQDDEVRSWFGPVVKDLQRLEKRATAAHRRTRRLSRRGEVVRAGKEVAPRLVGARPYFVQNALQDLVDFLDPAPFKFARPSYRKRLTFGDVHQAEQMRMPSSLYKLYSCLAELRDHKARAADRSQVFRDTPLEVFIKGAPLSSTDRNSGDYKIGDCPYSQRVIISLEELGVPYRVTPIDTSSKPGWFHCLTPESQVPVIFNEGELVTGSRHIMAYLIDKYPNATTAIAPSRTGPGRVGTMAYTRFYPTFQSALRGKKGALVALQAELRDLNATIARVQAKNGGALLGGDRFSREDTSIAPMLHLVDICGPALKGEEFGIPKDCVALRRYLNHARRVPSFAKSSPAESVAVEGFRTLLEKGASNRRSQPWLGDMLE